MPQRSLRALSVSFRVCLAWAAVLTAVFWFFGDTFAGLIASDERVRDEAGHYLRVVAPSLWGYGFTIVAAAAFNGIGRAERGFAYYVVRCAVFYVPAALLATQGNDPALVFSAIAAANVLSGVTVAVYALRWLRLATENP
ncbi:MAG: MATE family efflux transporter, partial [Myxococcota bacterium]